MARHTPGPWQIDPGDQGDSSVGMSGYAPYVFVPHPRIEGEEIILATLHPTCYDNTEEGDALELGDIGANAYLIGAASELLVRTDEALSLVGRFLDSHDRAAKPAAGCACVVCREARAWLHAARAAIAKAEQS